MTFLKKYENFCFEKLDKKTYKVYNKKKEFFYKKRKIIFKNHNLIEYKKNSTWHVPIVDLFFNKKHFYCVTNWVHNKNYDILIDAILIFDFIIEMLDNNIVYADWSDPHNFCIYNGKFVVLDIDCCVALIDSKKETDVIVFNNFKNNMNFIISFYTCFIMRNFSQNLKINNLSTISKKDWLYTFRNQISLLRSIWNNHSYDISLLK